MFRHHAIVRQLGLFCNRYVQMSLPILLINHAGLRFFNNMAVPIHTTEESIEALKAVYESFAAAMNLHGLGK